MATIPMSDVLDWRPLPIDAQDIVTKVRLLISGRSSGAEPVLLEASTGEMDIASILRNKLVVSHSFVPVVYSYTAAEHSTYGCERLVDLPEGTNPFVAPQDLDLTDPELSGSASGAVEEVRDGDPETYFEVTCEDYSNLLLSWPPTEGIVGFRAMYAFTREDQAITNGSWSAAFRMLHRSTSGLSPSWTQVVVGREWDIPPTETVEDLTETWAVANYDARSLAVNNASMLYRRAFLDMVLVPLSGANFTGVMRLYHFYPLVLDTNALEEVAKSFVRLPAVLPRRVAVKGYVAPEREHTITGWPGGDYTGRVAQVQYDLGRTIIDFEQAAAPVGLPFESVEVERARALRTESAISAANYNVRIGGR